MHPSRLLHIISCEIPCVAIPPERAYEHISYYSMPWFVFFFFLVSVYIPFVEGPLGACLLDGRKLGVWLELELELEL
jgi:hypothetical protein